MKIFVLPFVMLLAIVFLPAFQSEQWDLIGNKTVKYEGEKDEISVTEYQGPYSKLKIAVEKASVHIYNMKIIYRNGQQQEVPMYKVVYPGQDTGVIDLMGGERAIDKIQFVYATAKQSPERGHILVFAKK